MTAPSEHAAVGRICVLLVEDHAGDAFLIQQILAGAVIPFEFIHVGRLDEALARLSTCEVDVVLVNLTLPDSTGIDTFRTLFAHPSHAPIIVLSGDEDEATALATVELGAQDYLVKGRVDQALLVRSIRYAIKRAEADRRLEEERNLLRSVIDNLPDAIYVKDTAGRYLLGNVAHMHQLGARSPQEVVGKTLFDFFPRETASRVQADDEQVMQTGQAIINRHDCLGEAPGPVRWFSMTKVPLRDPEGKISGLVGIGREITARKDAEQKLARYTEELREKNSELEDDMNLAREVQQAFLPQQFPVFPRKAAPEESAIRFFSKYLPTTALGGDFFHVLPISDSSAGVFICDVMGHGVRAALVTAIQRALVEELTALANDPGEFLTQMNRALLSILRRTRSPMFATAFYLVVDTAEGTLRYANAGHPRPLHLRRTRNRVEMLTGSTARPGPALGVFDHSEYHTQQTGLEAHDLVFLFTDGLYEVESDAGAFYDQALLLGAVERRLQLPTEQVIEGTLDEVRQFAAQGTFVDDVCLVGIEIARIGELTRIRASEELSR